MQSFISSGGLNAETEAEEATRFQNALLVHLSPLFDPKSLLEKMHFSDQTLYELYWVFRFFDIRTLCRKKKHQGMVITCRNFTGLCLFFYYWYLGFRN